jgi:TatD DNase family protein
MIDSHCHLADKVFAGDLEQVVVRAGEIGVSRAMVILEAGNADEAAQARRVEDIWPAVRFAVGVHPHQAHQFNSNPGDAARAVRAHAAATPGVRAVGEIGLDYHYDFSPRDVQRAVFRAQIELASDLGLPVVIHTREADDDTVTILREAGGAVRGVFHCFTGNAALAQAALELGFYVSVAGIVTFPKAGELRNVLKQVPLDRLLTETDSPYLAPVPYRGKRNEPAHVVKVVDAMAGLLERPAAEVAARSAANFDDLFRP